MQDEILKLTNAVYKLLEYFPEADPLKNRAKDKALAILENPNQKDIDILLGYLEIAKNQGWLNSVNYLIVANEYEKLSAGLRHGVGDSDEAIQSISTNSGLPRSPKGLARNDGDKLAPRQKKIIEFLSKNEKAQVMDLQKIFPDITKRTIRRDLDQLLEMGQIERDGTFNQIVYKIKLSH